MQYDVGMRIELGHTADPYTRLQAGARGRITSVRDVLGEREVGVRWDDGSTLSMLPFSGDSFRVIPDESHDWMSDGERLLCANCEAGKLSAAGAAVCDAS